VNLGTGRERRWELSSSVIGGGFSSLLLFSCFIVLVFLATARQNRRINQLGKAERYY
jgi:uncharacterized membrane protein